MVQVRETPKASSLVRVADLPRAIAFHVDLLGFALVLHAPDEDIALLNGNGFPFLLAGPAAADFTSYLDHVYNIVRPGTTRFFLTSDPDVLQAQLVERGAAGIELIEKPWGDRYLTLPDPDGYTIAFWTAPDRTPEEILTLYADGPDALERALEGIRPAHLDMPHNAGRWTIRQLVHHIADSEGAILGRTKLGLAEPGREYISNIYDQDQWAEALDYAGRDVAPSIALFRAVRAHMLQLVRHLPDAWERATTGRDGGAFTAGFSITLHASHAMEHIEEIRETRRELESQSGRGEEHALPKT